MPVRRVILWLALSIIILGNATSGRADISNAGAVFLQRVNSAKANGMGGCVVTTVSEESAYYNPASIGLLHLDRAVSFVAPHSTEWLPEVADDLRLKSWSLSVGASRRLLKKSAPEQDNISFGLAYSYASLNYGTFTRVAETGEVIDQFESYDAANCLAVGFGYQHKVRIGFGYAIKFIESRLSDMGAGMEAGSGNADGTAHQLGLMVELPIHKLIACDEPQAEPSAGRTEIEVTPAFAYVLDNLGRDIRYIDAAQSDELPRMSRTGLSVLVAAVSGDKEYCSIRGSLEWEKPLIGDSPVLARAGVEIGILGAFFARRGLLEFNEVDSRLSTYGLGFRLRGLLNELLQGNRADDSCSLGAYLARHFDLAVDYAKYGSQDGNAFSKTWFYAISVSL